MSKKIRLLFNKVFTRYMVSYIVIMLLVASLGLITYSETFNIAKKNAISESLSSLEKAKATLDSRFLEIENLINQITLQDEIISLQALKKPLKNSDYALLRDGYRRISTFKLTNNFINDIFFILKDSETLISSKYVSDNIPGFYGNIFYSYSDMDYDEWKNRVMKTTSKEIWPSAKVMQNSAGTNMLIYAQPTSKGVILVHIDEKSILDHISISGLQQEERLFIFDTNGQNVLSEDQINPAQLNFDVEMDEASSYFETKENGQRVVVVHTYSPYLRWRYMAILPASLFEEQATYIKKLYTNSIVTILLIGILIAAYLSYRNSLPFKRLINQLKESADAEENQNTRISEYNYIEDRVLNLINGYKGLKEQMEGQIPLLRVGFFVRLIHGGFNKQKDINSYMTVSHLKIEGEHFFAVIMRFRHFVGEMTEAEIEKASIMSVVGETVLRQYMGPNCHIYNMGQERIAMLVGLHSQDLSGFEEEIEMKLDHVMEELLIRYNVSTSFGLGSVYSGLMSVNLSFQEAEQALRYKSSDESRRVIWYKNIPQKDDSFYYPVELELRLTNIIKHGEEKEARVIIDIIYQRNFADRCLPEDEINQLVYEIRGTILKLREEIFQYETQEWKKISLMVNEISGNTYAEVLFDNVKEIFILFCDHVNEEKEKKIKEIARKILDYVNSNYTDDHMCLSSIALKFDFNDRYLSQFFKEQTGENFSTYIENLRISKSVEMLSQTDLSVTDIARKVGYSNMNTFYKAFKRVFSMSPSTYRNSN